MNCKYLFLSMANRQHYGAINFITAAGQNLLKLRLKSKLHQASFTVCFF